MDMLTLPQAHPANGADVISAIPEPAFTGASLALALLKALPDSVYLMEPDGRITYINRAGLDHLDLTHQNGLAGGYLWTLWPDADPRDLRAALDSANDGEPAIITATCPRRGGGTMACPVTISPIEGPDGEITKILALIREA